MDIDTVDDPPNLLRMKGSFCLSAWTLIIDRFKKELKALRTLFENSGKHTEFSRIFETTKIDLKALESKPRGSTEHIIITVNKEWY